MSKATIVLMLILACVVCSKRTYTERDLVGRYYLYVNSPYANPNQPMDSIELSPGGLYSHKYTSSNHQTWRHNGSWSIRGDRVYIKEWCDYADITGLEPRGKRVMDLAVTVESSPPVIVIDDDRNVFYSRE